MYILSIILKNLAGYDLIIIVMSIINTVIYVKLGNNSRFLKNELHKSLSIPIREIVSTPLYPKEQTINIVHLEALEAKKNQSNSLYSIFSSFITIFPLAGILGTVISLLSLSEFSFEIITAGFTAALTSTFWGITAAIIFHFLEGKVIPVINSNNEDMNILLSRIDRYHSTEKGDDNA